MKDNLIENDQIESPLDALSTILGLSDCSTSEKTKKRKEKRKKKKGFDQFRRFFPNGE